MADGSSSAARTLPLLGGAAHWSAEAGEADRDEAAVRQGVWLREAVVVNASLLAAGGSASAESDLEMGDED